MPKSKYFSVFDSELDDKYRDENPINFEELKKPLFQDKYDDIHSITQTIHLGHLERVFCNKMNLLDINFSWAMFYYESGIPDDEWSKSPGSQGQSREFFPEFTKDIHWENYYNYSYFTTYFFHEAFSVLELIGHILNEVFRLDLQGKSVNFNSSIKKIKNKHEQLFVQIEKIRQNYKYTELVEIRHNMVHNTSPIVISSGVQKSKNTSWYGSGEYTTSAIIKERMKQFLQMINDIIHAIYFYETAR